MEHKPGFCPTLLEISVDSSVSESIATAASVNLARVLSLVWEKVDPEDFNDENIDQTGHISDEDKNYFRKNIISRLFQVQSMSRITVSKALSRCIGNMVSWNYKKDWPEFLDVVKKALKSESF